ncbi:hypothetical protein AABB24_008921 [Solanum stoloniferum]|uniref:Uncharacterized protein n=1 Tax=Solanum stoloniferum TaxID=62892 RepID=A0ABD2UG25_9SOLN
MKPKDDVLMLLLSSVDEDRLTTAKIVTITCGLATRMPFLPCEYIGQDRFLYLFGQEIDLFSIHRTRSIPVFIRTGNRSFFHVFVVFLMISFATSFSALYLLSKYPKAANFCKNFSITSLVSAMAFATFCFF